MKQKKSNNLEVRSPNWRCKNRWASPTCALYSKSYPEIDFVRSQIVSSMAPTTGRFINEQSMTLLNLLCNLIAWVLTEDQSDRPISNLSVEMSEATNRHVISFAQDIIYDVTRCKVKTPKRVGLTVLWKILTGSAELVKVHQTFSRVGDNFDIPNGILLDVENLICAFSSIGDINEVRFLCFVNNKNTQCHQLPPPQDALQKHLQRLNFQAAVWKRTCQSIFGLP
jgi:hypothetical protein